jgi:hypothetical protein
MKTKLDELLNSIDPARTLDQVSARVDEAINSFQIKSGSIKSWNTFKIVLTSFFCHTESLILQIDPPRKPHPDIDWGRCCRLLMKEYGLNGEKAAFEMVRTGSQGGLYGVLKAVAKRMIDVYTGNEVSARIGQYWQSLTTDEKIAASKEYLNKHGHLLPSELTEGSAARIRFNFIKVLEEHPNLIKRMRDVRQNYR